MHNKLIIVHENQYILEQRKSKVREAIETRKGVSIMTTFINNVNQYLSVMKIKQSYLSMITGIDKNKISRLLTGVQDESGADM